MSLYEVIHESMRKYLEKEGIDVKEVIDWDEDYYYGCETCGDSGPRITINYLSNANKRKEYTVYTNFTDFIDRLTA